MSPRDTARRLATTRHAGVLDRPVVRVGAATAPLECRAHLGASGAAVAGASEAVVVLVEAAVLAAAAEVTAAGRVSPG